MLGGAAATPAAPRKGVLKWRIAVDGSVHDVEVVSKDLEQTHFATCAAAAITALEFPQHTSEGGPVTMPFKF
jgi:hypothetical protein